MQIRVAAGAPVPFASDPTPADRPPTTAEATLHGVMVARRAAAVAIGTLLVALTVWTAALAKEARTAPALARIDLSPRAVSAAEAASALPRPMVTEVVDPVSRVAVTTQVTQAPVLPAAPVRASKPTDKYAIDPKVRWFNGRPVRPAKTMWMTITGYSPDARSCGDSADGLTATLHSVDTNGHRLVAADPRMLPYGSMVSVDGYDSGQIVPVLDCGGAIKGRRLDLLFPTHEQARKWGVKKMKVTLWQYADGKPADNPRKLR